MYSAAESPERRVSATGTDVVERGRKTLPNEVGLVAGGAAE